MAGVSSEVASFGGPEGLDGGPPGLPTLTRLAQLVQQQHQVAAIPLDAPMEGPGGVLLGSQGPPMLGGRRPSAPPPADASIDAHAALE